MTPPPPQNTTSSSLKSSSSSHLKQGTSKQTSVCKVTNGKSASEPEDTTNRPPKRNHTVSTTNDADSEPQKRYVYVPECSRCRARGFVCRTVLHAQEGQHSCAPCKLKQVDCSATREQNRVVEQLYIAFTVKKEPGPTKEATNETSSASGPPSKRRRSTASTLSPLSECTSSLDEDITTPEETPQCSSEPIPPLSKYANLLSEQITNLDKTVRELHIQLSDSRDTAKQTQDSLNEIIKLLRVQNTDPKAAIANLEKGVQEIVQELVDSQIKANGLVRQLHTELSNNHQKADRLTKVLYAHQQKHHCETLYAEGHVIDAAQSLLTIIGSESEDVIAYWIPGFTNKCTSKLERLGDEEVETGKHDEALAAYSAALSLDSISTPYVLIKWVKVMLLRGLINDTLDAAAKFKFPRIRVYRAICVVLIADDRITEAIKWLRQMQDDIAVAADLQKEWGQWGKRFQQRCAQQLGIFADSAMDSKNYKEAIEHFSTILSLDEVDQVDILIKRSKAWAMMNLWDNALKDANEVITLKKPSQQDNQRHVEVVEALETMLLKF